MARIAQSDMRGEVECERFPGEIGQGGLAFDIGTLNSSCRKIQTHRPQGRARSVSV